MTSQRAGEPAAAGELAYRWLRAQHAVVGRASHEVKNTLNAVSVNLAVVQSRLRRQQAPESVTRFADTALDQLELLTGQVEALLSLTRELPPTADVAVLVRQLATLLGCAADERPAVVAMAPEAATARTSAEATAVHAIVGLLLARAAGAPGGCECTVGREPGGGVALVVRAAPPVPVDEELASFSRAAGADIRSGDGGEIIVHFPPAPDPETA